MGDMADYINDETPPQNCLECQYWSEKIDDCELDKCYYGYGSLDLILSNEEENE